MACVPFKQFTRGATLTDPHGWCLGRTNGFAWASRRRQLRCVRIPGELVVRTRNGMNTLGGQPPEPGARDAVAAELDTTVRERILALVAKQKKLEIEGDIY